MTTQALQDSSRPAALTGAAAPAAMRPPGWMIAVTALLALGILAMAVAETNLWLHYLIDAGEPLSLVGLGFVALAGMFLYSRGQLRASLPLMAPWLLFPVITQGDQIIDNLSINWMRFIVHLLLALIFGIPVAVVVSGARAAMAHEGGRRFVQARPWLAIVPGLRPIADGRVRQGSAVLAVFLLAALMCAAVQFLGLLMVITLALMIWGVLVWGFRPDVDDNRRAPRPAADIERRAALWLCAGLVASIGLYFGYKNRPGAYQGSPAYYMDPSQRDAWYRIDRVPVPIGAVARPAEADAVRRALTTYGQAFERLLSGYYVLDRNYNYDYHNRLFLRHTPLLADYRAVGRMRLREAEGLRASADEAARIARPHLTAADPMAALLDDVGGYAAFTFARVPVLERMNVEFDRTEAGLQHSTHMYEGEGKVLGVRLAELVAKHRQALSAASTVDLTGEFQASSRAVHDLYANRIVGF